MKVKFTIEEVISQEFEMEFEVDNLNDAVAEIRHMYASGDIELDDPCLIAANVYTFFR